MLWCSNSCCCHRWNWCPYIQPTNLDWPYKIATAVYWIDFGLFSITHTYHSMASSGVKNGSLHRSAKFCPAHMYFFVRRHLSCSCSHVIKFFCAIISNSSSQTYNEHIDNWKCATYGLCDMDDNRRYSPFRPYQRLVVQQKYQVVYLKQANFVSNCDHPKIIAYEHQSLEWIADLSNWLSNSNFEYERKNHDFPSLRGFCKNNRKWEMKTYGWITAHNMWSSWLFQAIQFRATVVFIIDVLFKKKKNNFLKTFKIHNIRI